MDTSIDSVDAKDLIGFKPWMSKMNESPNSLLNFLIEMKITEDQNSLKYVMSCFTSIILKRPQRNTKESQGGPRILLALWVWRNNFSVTAATNLHVCVWVCVCTYACIEEKRWTLFLLHVGKSQGFWSTSRDSNLARFWLFMFSNGVFLERWLKLINIYSYIYHLRIN